jgi:cell division protein DivIC
MQLSTNKAELEKIAREKYYMKRDNEDIFIIEEED